MKTYLQRGFTVVELAVVVAVIGILVAITIGAYKGGQNRAYDATVVSDADAMNSAQTNAGINNGGTTQNYSTSDAVDAAAQNQELDFHPTAGNVIDVTTTSDEKEFCIRVYNLKGKVYNSAANAYAISSKKTLVNTVGSCT